MDDSLKEALDIVKAQAEVRTMTAEEIVSMVQGLAKSIHNLCQGIQPQEEIQEISPAKAIKEKSIVCLECGKSFRILTKKHLASHGLEAASYREKWGIKSKTPLVCKALQRERRKKMKDMKLWERRQPPAPSRKRIKVK